MHVWRRGLIIRIKSVFELRLGALPGKNTFEYPFYKWNSFRINVLHCLVSMHNRVREKELEYEFVRKMKTTTSYRFVSTSDAQHYVKWSINYTDVHVFMEIIFYCLYVYVYTCIHSVLQLRVPVIHI